jgi:hypothetical protein
MFAAGQIVFDKGTESAITDQIGTIQLDGDMCSFLQRSGRTQIGMIYGTENVASPNELHKVKLESGYLTVGQISLVGDADAQVEVIGGEFRLLGGRIRQTSQSRRAVYVHGTGQAIISGTTFVKESATWSVGLVQVDDNTASLIINDCQAENFGVGPANLFGVVKFNNTNAANIIDSHPLTRSGMVTAIAGDAAHKTVLKGSQVYTLGKYSFFANSTASNIPALPGLLPFGDVHLGHFGYTAASTAAATTNAAAIIAADAYAASINENLHFPSDVIFFDSRLTKTTGWTGHGCGDWSVNPAANRPSAEQALDVAPTQLVAFGTFARDLYIPGVSDGAAMGATRVNPSASGAGVNDAVYKWPSMMNANGTLRAVSIAVFDTSKGTISSGIRVIPDFGGGDGQDGYEVDTSNVRSTADVDFGIVCQNNDRNVYQSIQAVGHWRVAGRCIPSVAFWDGAGTLPSNGGNTPYNLTFNDCVFGGYVGSYELGSDTYSVVSVVTATVQVPWADTLCLRDDAVWDTVRYNSDAGWNTIAIGASITGVTQNGGDATLADVVFDADVSGTLTAGDTLVMRPFGGGNSHVTDTRVSLMGFTFSNGAMAHDQDELAAGQAFDAPSMCLAYSGHRMTERVFNDCIMHTIEEVAMHVHDAAKTHFVNLETEKQTDIGATGSTAMRFIVSPSQTTNTYATYPSGGTFQFYISANSSVRFPGMDWGPAVPVSRADTFNGAGDNGFFEPSSLVFPSYSGSSAYNGAFVIPTTGAKAGIRKPGHPGQSDAFIYDAATDRLEQNAPSFKLDRSQFESVVFVGTAGGALDRPLAGGDALVTLPGGTAVQIALSGPAFVALVAVGTNTNADGTGIFKARCATTPAITALATANTIAGVAGVVLTGSTGTSGNITVSALDGALHVENREGGQRVVLIQLLGS